MTASVWAGLLHDMSLTGPDADPVRTAAIHAEHRQSPWTELLGPLVVPDALLSRLDRAIGALGIGPVPVCAVTSTGAGGLVSLAERDFDDLEVVAAHSALRDLDDLAGNAARVAAAARPLLDPDRTCREVFVGLPNTGPSTPGWQDAAELVEAEGLAAAVSGRSGQDQLLAQLSQLVELDCPFVVSDPGLSPVRLAAAVLSLVDGTEIAELLPGDAEAVRVRRRLRGVWVSDPGSAASGFAASPP